MPVKKGRQQHYKQQKEKRSTSKKKTTAGLQGIKNLSDSSKENQGRLQQQGACNSLKPDSSTNLIPLLLSK
jgi:hypothetical protein